MDRLIDLKRKDLAKAVAGLEKALRLNVEPDVARDVTLMRFSFTSELAWKVLKLYIEGAGGAEIVMPKDAYRGAQQRQLLAPEETEMALQMVSDRNRLAHDYSEKFAQALYGRIKSDYSLLLRNIFDRMSS